MEEKIILVLITPDCFKVKEKIFNILREHNFDIKTQETILLKTEDIQHLYTNPEKSILKDWKGGPTLIFLASKKRSLLRKMFSNLFSSKEIKGGKKEIIELVGDIDQPESIRGKFALSESKCAIFVPKEQNIKFFFPNGVKRALVVY